MDAAYSLCVLSVCVLLLCLRVIVLDKRTCGQGWKGGCPIPASLCLLLNNEVNNTDPSSLAHFGPRSFSPSPQLGSTWGLPPHPPSNETRPSIRRLRFYQHSLPKTLSTGKSHWYFWGFIESCLEISTAHRFKRNLFATICLGGTEAFATGPSLMCPLKGKAYLTGRQNKGVVASGFDTFIATVTIKDATNMHAWMIAWGHVSYGTDRRACQLYDTI